MSVAVFIIIDKISIADFVRHYFDNPKATRCRSSLFNGFSIVGGYDNENIRGLIKEGEERLFRLYAYA